MKLYVRIKRRGAALITVMLLSVFLLTIGLARLYIVESDYRAAHREGLRQEAYYLALSGIYYYALHPPPIPSGVPFVRAVPVSDSTHFFELTRGSDGSLRSRGYILSGSNKLLAQRTLALPGNAIYMDGLYDTGN